MHSSWMEVLNSLSLRIGCSIIPCIQSVWSIFQVCHQFLLSLKWRNHSQVTASISSLFETFSYDFYSTVITMGYGFTVGLTHFKYFQTWEMTVLMVTGSMFTNLKQKFWKCENNTTSVGNRIKPLNMRFCIQFYFRNLGLHPKHVFLLIKTTTS